MPQIKFPYGAKRGVNALALKISIGAGGLVLVVMVIMASVRGIVPEGFLIAFAVAAVAAGTYAVVNRFVATRLELARSTLKQVRNRQFKNLEAARLPKGDEMSALVWDVYQAGLALQKEIDELKKIENYRREFLGDVSHELRTPTFAIKGFAETLLDGALEDAQVNRQFLEKIQQNAHRLDDLLRDLIEISRIETGELIMTSDTFDLKDVVREVVESLDVRASLKDVTLSVDLAPGLPPVEGDRERIRQVLANLVDNAVKYNNPGGTVEISAVRVAADRIRIAVKDSGIGIAREEIGRVTERFYRVDRSRSRQAGGTGLGLAIVKHILEAHGRKLVIESTPGKGSIFSFTLKPSETAAVAS